MVNYYEVLGVDENADIESIKKTYRDLARKYHPDSSDEHDAEERMKQINEAYEVLGNSEKKQQYDFHRSNPHGGFDPFNPFAGNIWNDFGLHEIFRNGSMRQAKRRNSDLQMQIAVTLEDTLHPLSVNPVFERTIQCKDCGGKGGHDPITCPVCNGQGMRTSQINQGFMQFMTNSPCGNCHGTGTKYNKQCGTCNGFGLIKETINENFTFPLGCVGRRFKFDGLGNQEDLTQKPGDAYIDVVVKPHPKYAINGHSCLYRLNIDPVESIVGGQHVVEGIDGRKVTVNIPKGAAEGYREEFSGLGIPTNENERGSFFVETVYKVPNDLTTEQEEILKEYLKIRKGDMS